MARLRLIVIIVIAEFGVGRIAPWALPWLGSNVLQIHVPYFCHCERFEFGLYIFNGMIDGKQLGSRTGEVRVEVGSAGGTRRKRVQNEETRGGTGE